MKSSNAGDCGVRIRHTAIRARHGLAGCTVLVMVIGGCLSPPIRFLPRAEVLRIHRDRIYLATQKQARFLLGTVHPWDKDPTLRLLTDSKSGEHWVRPNTGAVAGFCFLYRYGPYDEKLVGVSRSALLADTILPMMRYLVATHVTGDRPTGDGKPWGDAWQSAHWAHALGRSAWWIWEDLPADVREGVQRVVTHEADRFVSAVPPHQIVNDTKAEENAWNSQILSVAVLLMPDDARRPAWEAAFQKWAMSSFLSPADERSDTVVDGRPVREQFTGANIYDDFTLENHGIVHPDYMTAFSLTLGCTLDFVMTGRQPPEALLYNVAPIYENLKWFWLPDGGFVYPSGQDWGLFRNADWLFKHVLMAVFARDPQAWWLAFRSLDTLEKMQARGNSGAVYQPGESFFASTQTDLVYYLSLAWLTLQWADDLAASPMQRNGARRLDSGKIILNRTPSAVHTFSWGAKVMAQCVPYRLDRIVSPHPRSGIGHIRLKGQTNTLPVKTHSVDVRNDAVSFVAELELDHGDNQVRAFLTYRSNAGGTWTMREKLVALADVTTTEIATGLAGILNNRGWIHERGERRVAINGQATVVTSCDGQVIEHDAATDIGIDSVLRISSPAPLHVRYIGAAKPDRARVTDELYLNYLEGERAWRAGDVISDFEVVMSCRSIPE